MLGMATYSFYDEIEISECPSNYNDLKEKIKELYILDEKQIENCLINYIDNDCNDRSIHYIFNEEQYQDVIPKIESIILNIEIINDDKYLTIEDLIDELNLLKVKDEKNLEKIKCSLCGTENFKIRYLCGICSDFNLCQKCEEDNGRNHGHPLLKIRSPELAPISFSYKLEVKKDNKC